MSKLINTDSDYNLWISQLVERYRNCQIRATVKANEELLRFYWSTGEDIVKKKAESRWGESVINSISQDLTSALPGIKGLSPTNLGYAKRFYSLYSQLDILPTACGQNRIRAIEDYHLPHSVGASTLSHRQIL